MDINNMAQHILTRMPANLTKIEQARYTYLQLGRLVTFDEKYWLGNSKTRRQIYKSARRVRDFKDMKNNKVICVSISNLYNSLLSKLGIEAEAVRAEDEIHVYTIFKIDGVEYEADLQRDLQFIQTHRKTRMFGRDPEFSTKRQIPDDKMKEMDEKFGYTYEGDERLSILIDRLSNELKQIPDMEEKVKFALEEIADFEAETDMGFVEKMSYYELLLADIFDKQEANKTQIMDMYIEKDGERKYTCCISANKGKNEYCRFIYSEKTGTFLPIDEADLIELMDQGLRTVANRKVIGLKKAKKKEEDKSIEK